MGFSRLSLNAFTFVLSVALVFVEARIKLQNARSVDNVSFMVPLLVSLLTLLQYLFSSREKDAPHVLRSQRGGPRP